MRLILETHSKEGMEELIKFAQTISSHLLIATGKITSKLELDEGDKPRMLKR